MYVNYIQKETNNIEVVLLLFRAERKHIMTRKIGQLLDSNGSITLSLWW